MILKLKKGKFLSEKEVDDIEHACRLVKYYYKDKKISVKISNGSIIYFNINDDETIATLYL